MSKRSIESAIEENRLSAAAGIRNAIEAQTKRMDARLKGALRKPSLTESDVRRIVREELERFHRERGTGGEK